MNDMTNGWNNEELGEAVHTFRIEEYFKGFEPIAWTHGGQDSYYDTVRALGYVNEQGDGIEKVECIPWKDGKEVVGATVPEWLKKKIEDAFYGYYPSRVLHKNV